MMSLMDSRIGKNDDGLNLGGGGPTSFEDTGTIPSHGAALTPRPGCGRDGSATGRPPLGGDACA